MIIGFDRYTGQINQTIQALQDKKSKAFYADPANWPEGIGYLEIEEKIEPSLLFEKYMARDERLVSRPIMPLLRDAVSFPVGETYRFDGIPKGAWIRFDGKEGACEDGVLDLTASAPGEYSLSIEKWPFLDAEVRVNVVPAQMGANS